MAGEADISGGFKMNRAQFSALVIIGLLISTISFGVTYGGGSGTEADPYQIWTPQLMNTIGADPNDWDKCFKLMADVNMSIYTGTQYKIIGNFTTKYTGTFDGNHYAIRNLTYTTTSAVNYIGVFGCCYNATIKDLGVENITFTTEGYSVGGLALHILG